MKVYLDAGHGGKDSGAVGIGGRLEKDDAQRLTDLVADILENAGVTTVVNTNPDESLAQVATQANKANVDLFVSIHRNAFDDPKANGLEVWTCLNARPVTKANANLVYDRLLKVAPMIARGVKESDFYLLKHTNAPAMLLELGFITNHRDNELFDKYIFDYADAVAKAILEILNVTCDSKKYKVLIGTYSDKKKADEVCRDARIKGFWETTVIE